MRAKNNGSRIVRRNAALVQSVVETLDQRVLFSVLLPQTPVAFGPMDTGQEGTAGGITLVKNKDALGNKVTDIYVGGSTTTVGAEIDQLLLAFNASDASLDRSTGEGSIPFGQMTHNVAGTDIVNAVDADSTSGQIFLVGSSQVGLANASTVGSYEGYDLAGNATGGGRALSAASSAVPTTFNAVQIFPRSSVAFAAGKAAAPAGTGAAGTQFAVAEIGTGAGGFGDSTNLATTFNFGADTTDAANAIGIQTSRVIVAGSSTEVVNGAAVTQIAIAGLSFNGPTDQSFKNGDQKGLIRLTIPGSTDDTATAVTIEPDNSILIAGIENATQNPSNATAIFIHLLPDGAFDTNFGTNGILKAFQGFNPVGVGISNDGRITTVDKNTFSVARINPNGTVDTTFGNTGTGIQTETFHLNNVLTAPAATANATGMVIYHNAIGSDDILYATGSITDGTTTHIALLGQDLPAASGVSDLKVTKLALAPDARKSVTFNKATGIIRVPVNITVTGGNQSYNVDFSLSSDTVVGNADDILLQTAAFAARSSGGTVFLKLPASAVFSGTYHVVATVHPTGGQLETSAFDNSFINLNSANAIAIKNKGLLQLQGLQFSDQTSVLSAGEPKFVTLAINNIGGPLASTIPVKFEFSASSNPKGKFFASPFTEAITAGLVSGANTVQVPIVTPAALTPGTYYIRATVDPKSATGAVPQFTTTLSSKIFGPITVQASPIAPDYAVVSVVPGSRNVAAGQTATARVTIKNIGTGGATKPAALGIALELSSDGVPGSNVFTTNGASSTPADLAVATVNVQLAKGQSHTYTIGYTFPSTFSSALESNGGKAFLVGEVNANTAALAPELDSLAVHNRGYARTPIIENFTSLQPTQILSATSKIVTVNVTNSGTITAKGTARVILTAVDIGNGGTVIQNGLFNVDIGPGGSHVYKFLVNSAIAPLGASRIAVQIESNGVTSTDLTNAPTSKNFVTLP